MTWEAIAAARRARGGGGGITAMAGDAARGTAAIEFALMLPLIVLLFTGLFDLGYAAYESMEVQAAAEAGAQYAARNPWNPTAIGTAVVGATGIGNVTATPAASRFCACPVAGALTPITCTGSCANGDPPGSYTLVSAQKLHWTALPYPALPQPLTLTGQAVRRLQ